MIELPIDFFTYSEQKRREWIQRELQKSEARTAKLRKLSAGLANPRIKNIEMERPDLLDMRPDLNKKDEDK